MAPRSWLRALKDFFLPKQPLPASPPRRFSLEGLEQRVVPAAPVANADTYTVSQAGTFQVAAPGVLANDTDADNDSLTVTQNTTPSHGTLNINGNGSFTYTPDANFIGQDFFNYTVSDGSQTSTAKVTLNVAARGEEYSTAYRDDFNRPNSQSLGAAWQDNLGDFRVTGNQASTAVSGSSLASLPGFQAQDVAVQADVNVSLGQMQAAGLVARLTAPGSATSSYYYADISGASGTFQVNIVRVSRGAATRLAVANVSSGTGTLRFEVVGSSQKLFFDSGNGEQLVAFANDAVLRGPGTVGLRGFTENRPVTYDNVQVDTVSPLIPTFPYGPNRFTDAPRAQLSSEWQEIAGNFRVSGGSASNATAGFSAALLRGVGAEAAYAQATVNVAAGSGREAGLYTQFSNSGYYRVDVTATTTGALVSLVRYTPAGGQVTLDSAVVPGGASGTLRVETMRGSQKVFLNDSLLLTAHDSSLGAGSVGIKASGPAGTTIDDFQADELTITAALPFSDTFGTATAQQLDSGDWQEIAGNFRVSGGTASNATAGFSAALLRGVGAEAAYAQATVNVAAGSGREAGLYTQFSNSGYYRVDVTATTTGALVSLVRYTPAGGQATLASINVSGGVSGTLRLETMRGSQRVFLNGSLLLAASDSSLGAGAVGIKASGAAGTTIDNFLAGTLQTTARLPYTQDFAPTASGRLGSEWAIQLGNFVVDGTLRSDAQLAVATLNGINAANLTLKADVNLEYGSDQSVALLGRYSGTGEGTGGYGAELVATSTLDSAVTANIYRRNANGTTTLLATTTTTDNSGTLEFDISGTSLVLRMDGVQLLSTTDATFTSGTAGVRLEGTAGTVSLDNFRATSP